MVTMRIQSGVLTVILSSILFAGCYTLNPSEYVGPDGAALPDGPAVKGADVAQPDVPIGGTGGGGIGGAGGASGGLGGSSGATGVPDAPGVEPDVPMGGSIGGTGGIGGAGGTGGGAGATTGAGGTTAVGGTGGGTTGVGGTPAGGGAGGGTTGSGPIAGTGGITRTGGATGTGGSGGTGGTAGAGGSSGTGGSTQPSLNCSAAVTPANGYVTDFSDYNTTTGTWGNTSGLCGTIFSDGALTATVDTTHGNLHITGTLPVGSFGNFGLSFNVCATVATFSSISFTLAGSAPGCGFGLEIQTYDQLPTTNNPPGGCVTGPACERFPGKFHVATPSTTPTVVTTNFGSLMANPWSAADAAQVVGIQFQFENAMLPMPPPGADGGTLISCSVDVTIDDVKFVP